MGFLGHHNLHPCRLHDLHDLSRLFKRNSRFSKATNCLLDTMLSSYQTPLAFIISQQWPHEFPQHGAHPQQCSVVVPEQMALDLFIAFPLLDTAS